METIVLENLLLGEVEHCKISFERKEEEIVLIHLQGYLDSYNYKKFENEISKIIALGFHRLIFEFSGITYISSAAIGSFIIFQKEVKKYNGDLIIVNPKRNVHEVFALLGFVSFFNITNASIEGSLQIFTQSYIQKKGFPALINCPICTKRLKANRAGTFRCPECKTVLRITDSFETVLR